MRTNISNEEYKEKKLLLRISGGDEQAFAQLFHAWQGRMFQYIRTIVKSPQVAEEIVMDVMTKLWLGREMLPRASYHSRRQRPNGAAELGTGRNQDPENRAGIGQRGKIMNIASKGLIPPASRTV